MFSDPPPFRSHLFNVGQGHWLHGQESGCPDGLPALVLHGGPGSGCSPLQRRFFDPQRSFADHAAWPKPPLPSLPLLR